MPKLHCSVNNCCYNKNCNCLKSVVSIQGECATETNETCCESFKKKDRIDRSGEYNSEFAFLGENMRASVNCACTKCRHNRNEMCYAEYISVDGRNARNVSETKCLTFVEK